MIDLRLVGPEAAADLARLWVIANAAQVGEMPDDEPAGAAVEKQRRRLGGSDSVGVLAIDGDAVIACCCVTPSLDAAGEAVAGVAHLTGVAVDPARWGHGLGSAVVERAVEACRDLGYRRVRLHVVMENDRARRLYERLGWRLVETDIPDPDNGPEAMYELDIDRRRPLERRSTLRA